MLCHVCAFAISGSLVAGSASGQEYYYDSYHVTNQHRVQEGLVGGSWGHHLGHMVRTATQGLWYVDDTGADVTINPNINYHQFDGTKWVLKRTLANPATIQQNTTTLAVGDTIFSYGVNINGGYIEEAVCYTPTNTASYNRRIRFTGGNTNYIGAALSPRGTRVVWWTRVVNAGGPSDWVYMFKADTGWVQPIVSQIPGNDFSYVFASFLNDSTFYVGGEVPSGNPPSWTFEAAAGKVVLGHPLQGFTKMKGSNIGAQDIWVNRANGDVHFLVYGSYGNPGYFYKPAGGAWNDTVMFVDIGGVGRSRLIDHPDGNLYYIVSQNGFRMMTIPKSSITGKIDFAGRPLVSLGTYDGYNASYAIWPEVREFQTAPVGGINFAYPGNDYSFAIYLRHTSVKPNPGNVALRVSLPNGLEVLEGNKNQTIYWYAKPGAGIDTVSIDFSSNGGSTWTSVTAKTPNKGSYAWKVPTIASSTCRIRLNNALAGSPLDTSDANFAIQYTPVISKPPTATITRPTKDTTVVAGTTMTFEGIATDSDGYIISYLWKTGDGRVVKGIARKFDHIYNNPGTYFATMEVQDNDTLWSSPDSVKIIVTPNTGVNKGETLPQQLQLHPNYPNPFNAGTVFSYALDKAMQVRLRIFGIRGEEVARLVDGAQPPGEYRVWWDARRSGGQSLASGWYVCRLETPEGHRTQKVLLVR
jgi:hypothetical protein